MSSVPARHRSLSRFRLQAWTGSISMLAVQVG
jgi:hypothetical protein